MSVDPGDLIGRPDHDGSWAAGEGSVLRPSAIWEDAATAIDTAEAEVDRLWYAAIAGETVADLQRLAEVSHALGRAARLLRPPDAPV